MEASFRGQGKSTGLLLSTTTTVFDVDGALGGVPRSRASKEKSDEAACEQLDDFSARAGRGSSVAEGAEGFGVSVCFFRIHVALRWSGEETHLRDLNLGQGSTEKSF
jgi:hypothetical protein